MTTASVKERKEIFAELRQCIKGRGERFLIQFSTNFCLIRQVYCWIWNFSNIPFRITRTSYQRFMQALLPHPTQIQVGVYWKYVAYRVTDAKDMDFKMKAQFRWSMCLFFRDAASRREPLSVIGQLAETQPEILVTSLLHCLLNCGVISKSGVPGYTS